MMRLGFNVLCLCVLAIPANAQQSIESLCQNVSQFVPIDGVEYQPAAGEVPADLNSIQDPVYGSISIPVEIDLAEFFDRPALRNVPGLLLEPEIANIEVNQDGSVFYNGQEISADLRRVCGTPIPAVQEAPVVNDVAVQPPPPKPENKPPRPIKAQEKKSRVRVFNGPEVVISSEQSEVVETGAETDRVNDVKQDVKKAPVKPHVKPKLVDENAIDVEDLKAQDIKDDVINGDGDEDSILEGQYP